MNIRTPLWSAVVAVALAAGPWSSSFAQTQRPVGPGSFKITKIRQQLTEAPDYGSFTKELGSPTQGAKKRWLKIEVEFSSQPEWADDVQLKFYVLMGKGQDRKMLVGDVTHVNVARGQGHYSAMFVHPSTLERYGNGQAEAVAVQLYYDSRPLAEESDPSSRVRWWERFSPEPGYVLAPNQTPWSVIAYKRYEATKSR